MSNEDSEDLRRQDSNCKVYIFKEKRSSEPFLMLESEKSFLTLSPHTISSYRKAQPDLHRKGVERGEGPSSDEYYRTPERLQAAQRAFQSFLVDRRIS